MPIWFIAILTATLLWAIVVLIDDNLLSNVYRTASFGAIISGLFGFIPSFYLFLNNETLILDPRIVIPAVVTGILTVVFYYYYFKTLMVDEPSVTIALFNLAPAIVPFLAFIFLGELLHIRHYVGMAILVSSSAILSLVDAKKLKFTKSIRYAIAGSIIYAIVSITAKYAYDQAVFRDVYMWVSFGFGIGGLSFLILDKKADFKKVIKRSPLLLLVVFALSEFINIAAEFTQGFAISSGPVSLVRAAEGTQPIFILLLGILLSPIFPKYFRETIDKKFSKKLILMLIMVFGLVLIQS